MDTREVIENFYKYDNPKSGPFGWTCSTLTLYWTSRSQATSSGSVR
jgi:hypothetical protein